MAPAFTAPSGHYNELGSSTGALHPHWQPFFASSEIATPGLLDERWRGAERMIRENGVTYNVYADPRGLDRPWPLDPIPMIVPATEWQALEKGLVQRARLLDAILTDVYGAQILLREGVMPPGLVFGNPNYLRPCHGITPAGGRHLRLYAADLARLPDGSWRVLSDRTQAPSGSGYALENRMVVARSLPEAFRAAPVARLSGYFRALREGFAEAAAAAARASRGTEDEPRIVLLTPGPYNEVYFEHAYLARYLGYPLVAGEDLTVRNDRVYLKTLGGLQPVDGILRRLDDDYADPLWLNPRSSLGVAGLVAAARRGYVAIANALGSGLVESPALMPYLPALCRRLLGEDLTLHSAETRWCGAPGGTIGPDSALADRVVRPAFAGSGREPVFAAALTGGEYRRLAKEIAEAPAAWVVQEKLKLSCVPVWGGGRLTPRPMVLRAFLAAKDDGYAVLPGGLTRVSGETADSVVSLQQGGRSKDTWVLTADRSTHSSLWQRHDHAVELRRHGADLPSRIADNLFWLGRYGERSEAATRLARAVLARVVESGPGVPGMTAIAPLLGTIEPLDDGDATERSDDPVARVAAALKPPFRSLHRVATGVRDRLSTDTWRILHSMARAGISPAGTASTALAELDELLSRMAAFNGMAMENMTRGAGWRFLELGRRLERAVQITGMIRILGGVVGDGEAAALEALLEVCDSGMTYRSRYFTTLEPAAVLDLVLADDSNPRALAFQLAALDDHIRHLPRERPGAIPSTEARLAAQLLTVIRRADLARLAWTPEPAKRPGTALPGRPHLERFMTALEDDIFSLSDAVSAAYFKHATAAPVVGRQGPATGGRGTAKGATG
ncbi:MAG TPA: circularly permuted type 2 ATP-grasp protein [Stellaceae bacterium]|nr:circularly permuted type 2 ATP-grasp protein [Stellaceae bacterium]